MRFVELQTRPLTEAAPTPNTIGKEKDTIIAQQVSATEVELYVTDDRGKVLKARTGSASGGSGGGTTPPIKDVLTAGNDLDGKHFEGVLKSIDADVPNNVSSTFSSDKDSVSYSRTTNDENTSFEVGSRGVSFSNNNTSLNEGTNFEAANSLRYSKNNVNSDVSLEASDFSLKYSVSDKMTPGNDMEFRVEKERATYTIPYRDPKNPMNPVTPLRYEVNAEGIKADKYLKPTQDEQYVQKKYVDGLLDGKPAVIIDRMYLNYAGKLAVDITVTGLGSKASDLNVFKDSVLQTFIRAGGGNVSQSFGFSSGSNAIIRVTNSDTYRGIATAHIEISSTYIAGWGDNTGVSVLSNTIIEFTYIPSETSSDLNTWVKSGRISYGEKFVYGQAGVVDYKFRPGGQSLLISNSNEYKFFKLEDNMFDLLNPAGEVFNNYNYPNGSPIGSYDSDSGKIISDNRIMPNPTPSQVTDWELTLHLSGNNIDVVDAGGYRAVIYDAEDNPIDEVPIFPYTGGLNPAPAHNIKVTLRTVNSFKNIVGNKRGFKLGIKVAAANASLDVNFELKHIRRISYSLV